MDLERFAEADINSVTMTGVIESPISEEFIKKHGEEVQRTTKDFTTRAIGSNYAAEDGFLEFVDNAYDSIEHNRPLNFSVKIDNENNIISFRDDGDGIKDTTKLFQLGGTDKRGAVGKIGKYGIGVSGACAAIATKCVFDKDKPVYIKYESCRKGRKFTKYVLVEPNGNVTLGKDKFDDCDEELHYTEVTFTNVQFKNTGKVADTYEEFFEIPLHSPNGINISINGRQLGKSGKTPTFIGDEKVETVMVGEFKTYVKYRIIGGTSKDDRSFDESGLRFYSQSTGRLLSKDKSLWRYFAGRDAQQGICGIRAGVFIEDSVESYRTFGVKSTKNGIVYANYFDHPGFEMLAEKLHSIYVQANNTSISTRINEVKLGSKTFIVTKNKIKGDNELFCDLGDTVVIKSKYSPEEIAFMVNEILTLKKKLERKTKRQ